MSSDRNLLLGMLALHAGLVTHAQLLEGLHAWMLHRETPLGVLFCQHGMLEDDDRRMLEGLVDRQVKKHGDEHKSLAAMSVDAQVQASLVSLGLASETTPPGELVVPQTVFTLLPVGANGGPRFRVLRPHARGGLGEVSVARDEELGREVALKQILERFADDAESRSRFLREAEITGNLEHPGIVPVYGLLTYPDGRPVYAMRFIHGESLHDAIGRFHQADKQPRRDPGERSLALRGLLTRFVTVCNAVGYAHSRGVIHRDLKPANVMLGEYGETLVVDWGLAKVLTASEPQRTTAGPPLRLTNADTTPTVQGQVMGTPAYLPPEQARGEHDRVEARTDVWALGATLYVLLTGKAPYSGKDVLEQARGCQFVPPRQVKFVVPPALEAVCLKAMAAKPEDRYTTARELAQDVEHWLADEPVTAFREPVIDRVRRWGRRHRSVVTAAVAALVVGVAGLGLGLWAVNREKEETVAALWEAEINLKRAENAEVEATGNLRQAEANLTLAKDAVNQCFNVGKDDPLFQLPRMEKAKKMLLAKTLPFYQRFRAGKPGDPALGREEAKQWFNVAYIENVLGNGREAKAAYEETVKLYRQLGQAHPGETQFQRELASTHHNLAGLLRKLGEHEEARRHYQHTLNLQLPLHQAYPNVAEYQEDVAITHNSLGILLANVGQREEALKQYQQALKLQQHLYQAHPSVSEYQKDLARTHHNLGNLLRGLGRREEARKHYEHALKSRLQLSQAHPDGADYQQTLARTHHSLGNLLYAMGQLEGVLQQHEHALKLRLQLHQTHPDVPEYQQELASTHNLLGIARRDLGQREEARKQYQHALELQQRLHRAHPTMPEYPQALANTYNNLALLLSDLGQPQEARKHHQHALKLRLQLHQTRPDLPVDTQDLANTHNNLGLLLTGLGQNQEALKHYEQVLKLRRQLHQAHPTVPGYQLELASIHRNLGLLRRSMGERREALKEYQSALKLLEQLHQAHKDVPEHQHELASLHTNLGAVLNELGQGDEARKHLQHALKLLQHLHQAHPNVPRYQHALASTHRSLGLLVADVGQREEALKHLQDALRLTRQLHQAHPNVPGYAQELARAHNSLGNLLNHLDQREEARQQYQQGLKLQQHLHQTHQDVPAYQQELAYTHNNLGILLAELGQREEAVRQYQQAQQLRRQLSAAHPLVQEHQIELAASCGNLGNLLCDTGQPERSLVQFAEAIHRLHAVWKREPRLGTARLFLRNSHWGRARALDQLGRPREALPNWDAVLTLSPPHDVAYFRPLRATSLARAGEYLRSDFEVEELAQSRNLSGLTCYNLACLQGLNAASAARDAARPLPECNHRAEQYARQAVALLRRAATAGLFRDPGNRAHLEKDDDLVFLRNRPDYADFVRTLPDAKPANPRKP